MSDEELIKAILHIFGVSREQVEAAIKGTVKDEILRSFMERFK